MLSDRDVLTRLVFVSFAEHELSAASWERIGHLAKDIVRVEREGTDLASALRRADGLILRLGMSADASLQDLAPKLRYIGMFGTGYGRIDVEHARQRGIVVTNVANYATESVAELVIGMALGAVRNLFSEQQRAELGDVDETRRDGRNLGSLTVGVVGAGYIGMRVMRLMSDGFGARVLYWSRQRKREVEDEGRASFRPLPDLMDSSDLVSLHLASNQDTAGLIGSALLDRLRDSAVLINTAPNEILDLDSVIERCAAGTLRFAMDHADELPPLEFDRLRTTPNVSIFPPIGYATREAHEGKYEILISNMESFLAGTPTNVVNR